MSEGFDVLEESHDTGAHEANGLQQQFSSNIEEHAGVSDDMQLVAAVGPSDTVPSLAVDGAAVEAEALEPPATDVVETAQQELENLGYCIPDDQWGEFGWGTANATAEFQEMNNLPITGELDDLTLEELTDPDAVPNPLPCGAWDGDPIQVEGPGGEVIWVGDGFEHGHEHWHSDPEGHGWHDGHGHGG